VFLYMGRLATEQSGRLGLKALAAWFPPQGCVLLIVGMAPAGVTDGELRRPRCGVVGDEAACDKRVGPCWPAHEVFSAARRWWRVCPWRCWRRWLGDGLCGQTDLRALT